MRLKPVIAIIHLLAKSNEQFPRDIHKIPNFGFSFNYFSST